MRTRLNGVLRGDGSVDFRSSSQPNGLTAGRRLVFHKGRTLVRRRCFVMSAVVDKRVEREWSGPAEDEGGETGEVEKIRFVARGPELRTRGGDSQELDGAETEAEMYGNDGDDEKNRHGNTSQGDEYTEKDGEAAEDFGEDGDPCHEVRCGRAERLKDGGEVIGAATEFGEAVLYEAE